MKGVFPALVIGGPTASGKSGLALEVAERFGGEIVGADAFQIYRGLPILTAQPSRGELERVPHHMIGEFGLGEAMDVTRYVAAVRKKIAEIRERGRRPILVGGTGLYIRSVLFGLAEGLPEADPVLRAELSLLSCEALGERLRELDPKAAAEVDMSNPRRLIRAVEVCLKTGRPFSGFRHSTTWEGSPIGVWLQRPRSELHERIRVRTGQMFEEGVVEEVRSALPKVGPTASQVLGLGAIRSFLEGAFGLEEAVEGICTATRQYAKRQETWFRKENALVAVTPEEALERCAALLR